MTTPTILQIIPRLDTGGAEKSTVEIAQALAIAGSVPLVACSGGRMAADIEQVGGEVIDFPADTKNPIKLAANVSRLAKLICRRNVDLVHVRSRAPAWSAYYACLRAGRPFLTTYHGAHNNKGPFKNFYNSIMARGDLVIANSQYTAEKISQQHHVGEERMRVIYRGIDLDVYSRSEISEERVAALRESWGVGDDDKLVFLAARLSERKGQRVAIKAAGELARRGAIRNVVFILAGETTGKDEYVKELETLIKEQDVEDHVKIVGHVDDIAAALVAASVAIVTSIEPEAFGRAAAEAQAASRPVIVTEVGAMVETVLGVPHCGQDKATGWFVPPGDEIALSDAITALFGMHDTERHLMGMRAREHVSQNFSLETMRYETLAVYDELIGSRLAPVYAHRQGKEANGEP